MLSVIPSTAFTGDPLCVSKFAQEPKRKYQGRLSKDRTAAAYGGEGQKGQKEKTLKEVRQSPIGRKETRVLYGEESRKYRKKRVNRDNSSCEETSCLVEESGKFRRNKE